MKVLALLSRFPYPLEKGDKLRAFHLLREVARQHEVHLFALSDCPVAPEHLAAVNEWATSVEIVPISKWQIGRQMAGNLFRPYPFQAAYFYHPHARKQLAQYIQQVQPDHLYCQLLRMALYAHDYPDIPATLDYMDAFAAGMQRRAQQASGWEKWAATLEYGRLKRFEHTVFPWFQHHTIISEQDQQLIHHPNRKDIHVISNGIDTDFFKPGNGTKDIDLVFAGNMSYPPNVRAAVTLAKDVVPLLLPSHPQLKVAIVGTEPTAEVQALANEHIIVTGWVDDIRLWYGRAKVMVAPMDIGAGLQNKLLEAMAMALPCVTTPLAAHAMHPQLQALLSIGESSSQLAEACLALLHNDEVRVQTGNQSRKEVQQQHDWAAMAAKLTALWH